MNWKGAATSALFATAACTGTGATVTVPLPATAIVVDPAEFLGNVPCFPVFAGTSPSVGAGAMRRYVATLRTVHAGGALGLDAGVELPSSPPTRCSDRVSFQRVVDGTAYVAEIDGYDVDDIKPLGTDGVSGSRVMVDRQNRFVRPRWQTSCGLPKSARAPEPADAAPDGAVDAADARATAPPDARAEPLDTGVAPYGRCTGHALEAGQVPDNLEGPVCAIANVAIPMRGCEPLREVNPPSSRATAITVDLSDALAAPTLADGGPCLVCGDGPGQISGFHVELEGSSAAPRTAVCSGSVSFDLPTGQPATFVVTAYGSGASPDAGVCSAGSAGQTNADGSVSTWAADAGHGYSTDGGACSIDRQLGRGNAGIWCTRCFGQPLPGVTLRAACDPLVGPQLPGG
jgi:hypothetical protein